MKNYSSLVKRVSVYLTGLFSKKTGIALSTAKLIFDWVVVIIAAVLSLVCLGMLSGVREGTVIAAFGVGLCLKVINRLWREPLARFLGNE